jgi:hypothetical protein
MSAFGMFSSGKGAYFPCCKFFASPGTTGALSGRKEQEVARNSASVKCEVSPFVLVAQPERDAERFTGGSFSQRGEG